MPLYDVYCTCGHKEEMIIKLDGNMPLCTKCGKTLKIAMSCPNFILKGGGWEKDGYSKRNKDS